MQAILINRNRNKEKLDIFDDLLTIIYMIIVLIVKILIIII
jgi:hypothetical protein